MAAFPTSSVVDDFNRADNDSPGANWTEIDVDVDIASNQLSFNADAAVYYNAAKYLNFDAFFTLKGTGRILFDMRQALSSDRNNDATTVNNWSGHYLDIEADFDTITLWRYDSGSANQRGTIIAISGLGTDSTIGVRLIGHSFEFYHKPSAGSWTLVGSRWDDQFDTQGRIGLHSFETTQIDDFSVATYTPSENYEYMGGALISYGGGATSIVVDKPDNIAAGDTILFLIHTPSSSKGTIVLPAGVTQVGSWVVGEADDFEAPAIGVFKATWDGIASTYTFTGTISGGRGGSISAVGYKGTTSVAQIVTGTATPSSANRSSPAITATVGNRVVVFYGGDSSFTTTDWAPPFKCRLDYEYYGMVGVVDDAATGSSQQATGDPTGSDTVQSMWIVLELGSTAPEIQYKLPAHNVTPMAWRT